jgi:hypothetical protein
MAALLLTEKTTKERKSSKEKGKTIMEKVQFCGIDDWGRPIFKSLSREKAFFGSIDKLFGYEEEENEVLKAVDAGDLLYFGSRFNCEPMGTTVEKLEIKRATPKKDTVTISEKDKFNYMMLSRLKSDCEYFLGYGDGNKKRLCGDSVEEHIEEMKKIYRELPEAPEWLSLQELENYNNKMQNYSLK